MKRTVSTATITGIMIEKTSPGRKPRRLLGGVRGLGWFFGEWQRARRSRGPSAMRTDEEFSKASLGFRGFRCSAHSVVGTSSSTPACGLPLLRQPGQRLLAGTWEGSDRPQDKFRLTHPSSSLPSMR
ncbi:MAG: hypothetical protein ACK53L_27435 [Pirellulaceae bacterium]